MKKFLFVLMLCAAAVACKKEDAAATADAAAPAADVAAPAADVAAPVADVAAPVAADATTAGALPAACEDYFKRAEACFAKSGAGGAAMKSAFDQSRAQMAQVPADQMEMGCKAASSAFAQTAAALKCE
jgi:hypothetical protein